MEPILECHSLVKHYGANTALAGIDLEVPRGRIVGLLGPNGSGKTTLLKLANGLLAPSSGEILIDGMAPGVATKQLVSYLPDASYLPDGMTVTRLLQFYGDFFPDFNKDQAAHMLMELNIGPNARLKQLSKGNKEKVQLILAMSRQARLYLLDEPIGGVDPAARDYILHTIIGGYNPEATVIISTHLISDVEPVLDDVIFIRQGRILLNRPAEDLRAETGMSVDNYFREVFRC